MTTRTITISYNDEKHPAMLRLSCEPKAQRSEIVRDAVAQYYERHNGTTLDDVMRAIDDLRRCGFVQRDFVSEVQDEPSAAALALEELGR